jgi:hypothetical protein
MYGHDSIRMELVRGAPGVSTWGVTLAKEDQMLTPTDEHELLRLTRHLESLHGRVGDDPDCGGAPEGRGSTEHSVHSWTALGS